MRVKLESLAGERIALICHVMYGPFVDNHMTFW